MNKKIIITGATGFLGSRLAYHLYNSGYDVVSFSRDPKKSKALLPFVTEHIKWDYERKGKWFDIIDGASGIVNFAGANLGGQRWTEKYKKVMLDSRVKPTLKLAEAINKASEPPFLINASAIGYYEDSDEEFDENGPRGNDLLSQICGEWEDAAKTATKAKRIVIARQGLILDKEEGVLPKFLTPYKYYAGGSLGTGKQWMSWIHIQDVMRLYEWLIANEHIIGAINFTSPQPLTNKSFSEMVGKYMKKPNYFRVPVFILKLILGESALMILKSQRVVPRNAVNSGFNFMFEDTSEALKSLLS